jgi:hypothetical protein
METERLRVLVLTVVINLVSIYSYMCNRKVIGTSELTAKTAEL